MFVHESYVSDVRRQSGISKTGCTRCRSKGATKANATTQYIHIQRSTFMRRAVVLLIASLRLYDLPPLTAMLPFAISSAMHACTSCCISSSCTSFSMCSSTCSRHHTIKSSSRNSDSHSRSHMPVPCRHPDPSQSSGRCVSVVLGVEGHVFVVFFGDGVVVTRVGS